MYNLYVGYDSKWLTYMTYIELPSTMYYAQLILKTTKTDGWTKTRFHFTLPTTVRELMLPHYAIVQHLRATTTAAQGRKGPKGFRGIPPWATQRGPLTSLTLNLSCHLSLFFYNDTYSLRTFHFLRRLLLFNMTYSRTIHCETKHIVKHTISNETRHCTSPTH